MMVGCNNCLKVSGAIFVVLGILFLLVDLGILGPDLWKVQWWTALFIVVGVGSFASSRCPECTAIRTGKKK